MTPINLRKRIQEWRCRRRYRSTDRAEQRELTRLRDLGWPDNLSRATWDTWFFAARLRTGEVVPFTHAEVEGNGETVRLIGVAHTKSDADGRPPGELSPDWFERGLSVRVADIVWVADRDS